MPFSVELTYDSERNSFSLAIADTSDAFFSSNSNTAQHHRISLRQSAQSIALVVKNYESTVTYHSDLPALSPLSDISLYGENGKTFVTLNFRENHRPRVNWNERLRRLLVEQGTYTAPRHANTPSLEPHASLEPTGRAALRVEELTNPIQFAGNEDIRPSITDEPTHYARTHQPVQRATQPQNSISSRRGIMIEPIVAPVKERDLEEPTLPPLYMKQPLTTKPPVLSNSAPLITPQLLSRTEAVAHPPQLSSRNSMPSYLATPEVTSPYSASPQNGRPPLEPRVLVRDLLSGEATDVPPAQSQRVAPVAAAPEAALTSTEANIQREQEMVARNSITSPRVVTPPSTLLKKPSYNASGTVPTRVQAQRNTVAAHHQILTRIAFGTSPEEPTLRLETTQWPEYQIQQISSTHLIVTLKGARLGNSSLELPSYAPMNSSAVLYAKARQRGSDLQIDIFMEEGSPRLVSQARENALIFSVQ